ncbi:MAG: SHOCT domain-containing protein, partial [Thermodesulfobacteriota bacterium]
IFIGTVVLFLFKKEALAQYRDYYGWGMGPGMMGWGNMGWFGPIFMIIFWVLLVVLIVLLIRWLLSSGQGANRGHGGGESALEILKKRYARGEIDKEEFEAKKKDLS